ncbi:MULTISPECIES: hypothetical protein [Hymenobacter]|uniref:Uncharacterized protein n=1 Tax=Hymenobacter armeniacus TaxID=2771358 RepID=A0ABR8JVX1_9BACT|nr:MULTISPECIES: hypothetical protein [Hymenobacter]MBD2724114.1 hypothetical protein [Hymenobacter armeniacus]MBJ6110132.1 hypothetical protein [Hymenobacter sp. BT523]
MKKVTLLLALCAFATASYAQDVTPAAPKTEVKTRDNGTQKVVTKTGKTNVGAALDNTKDAAGNVAHKTGHAIKSGAKKTGHAVKRGANKVSGKAKEGSAKLEDKTE